MPVELFSDDRKAGCLLEIQTARRNEVARSEEIGEPRADVEVDLLQDLTIDDDLSHLLGTLSLGTTLMKPSIMVSLAEILLL